MISDHAIVEREGFKVPLIGIEPAAVLEKCELCAGEFPLRAIELNRDGKYVCKKCQATYYEK